MKKKNINVYELAREFNGFRSRNLGRRFSNDEMINHLKSLGFIYPTLMLMFLIKRGFLEKYTLRGAKLNVFTRIEITPSNLAQIIENAREYQRDSQGKNQTTTPCTRFMTLDECIDCIRKMFENEHLVRFGIIKDNIDVKDVLSSLGLKGQKAVLTYQDF